jgi:hypothetical protein
MSRKSLLALAIAAAWAGLIFAGYQETVEAPVPPAETPGATTVEEKAFTRT